MADPVTNFSPEAVVLLRANLGFYGSTIPEDLLSYLESLLSAAYRQLARAGVYLVPGTLYDDELQVMYAAWLYRKRTDGAAKPPMLIQEIRDRQVEQALAADEEATYDL